MIICNAIVISAQIDTFCNSIFIIECKTIKQHILELLKSKWWLVTNSIKRHLLYHHQKFAIIINKENINIEFGSNESKAHFGVYFITLIY